MRKINFTLLFGMSLFSLSSGVEAAPHVAAGLWEVSVTANMAGVQMPATAVQQCFTDSDVTDTKQLLPTGSDCEVSNYKLSGNSASWNMACKGALPMTGSGTATFGTGNFSGALTMTLGSGGGSTTQATQAFTARRIGNCPH